MTVTAIIPVDLQVTPLGTKSRLADDLQGTPILRRTVERVARCHQADRIIVTCPPAQRDRCAQLLSGTTARVQPVEAAPPPWRALVASARKWSLDSWRGGIGGSTCFDEYTDARIIAGLPEAHEVQAVLVVPPGAVLFDPDLADRMIAHGLATHDESKLTFAPTPPGLSGLLLNVDFVRELAEQSIPVGWVFSYKPDGPLKDLVFQPCCYEVPPEVRYAMGRLIADTDRAVARLDRLLTDHKDADARTAGRWLIEHEASHVDPQPREIEIELTTDDPYPDSVLRPRGARLARSGVMNVETFGRLVDQWMRYDDGLLVLGGFGEPLRHPEFVRLLAMVHRGLGDGVRGVCVRTSGVDLDDARINALIEHPPDVLTVLLDAWSDETYAMLQSPGDRSRASLGTVAARLDLLNEQRMEKKKATPIIVPELIKAKQNVHELDAFHDGWLRKMGAVCIAGAGHFAGQLDNHAVVNMTPPKRTPCRRIFSRCMVLSNGHVVPCDQDFKGLATAGNVNDTSLELIWTGSRLTQLRNNHRRTELTDSPLCRDCDEWHRP